ncbi:MAG: hypothetical protein ACK5QR_07420, partial [bacterium]
MNQREPPSRRFEPVAPASIHPSATCSPAPLRARIGLARVVFSVAPLRGAPRPRTADPWADDATPPTPAGPTRCDTRPWRYRH